MEAIETSISEIVTPQAPPEAEKPAPEIAPDQPGIPTSTKVDLFNNPIFEQSADKISDQINTVAKPATASELIEKRGRGRPKGTKNKSNPFSVESSEISEQSAPAPDPTNNTSTLEPMPEIPVTDYQALAALVIAMGTSTLAMVFGPEWQPEDENERIQLTVAVAKYMEASQVKDIPPGVLLTIVLLTYSAKRFRAPTTRQKINGMWIWFKSKFGKKV